MPFANINRHHMYYEDSGGRGPVILFSHGFLLDHSMWEEQVASSRCITWMRAATAGECFGPFDYYDRRRLRLAARSAQHPGCDHGGHVAGRLRRDARP
jgi:pimeloyl-ACP methyl ester carboxylesterase